MIYAKSVLAGLLALIMIPVCLVIVVVVGLLIHVLTHPPSGEGSIGWDPISLVRMNPILWSIPLLVFFIGFTWEYRRLAKRH